MAGWRGCTWRGVNHQRLPVDAIVVSVLMGCDGWCCREMVREEEETLRSK